MLKTIKQFNFSKHKQRYIALKLLYFGWDYDGLADQANNDNTIEYHLFNALMKTCLIESRSKCKYNRCGRTDKGVSSYGQVVNLAVRSNLIDESDPQNVGLFTPTEYHGTNIDEQITKDEINYIDILNRVLPDHIRAIAWAPAKENFSARFDCESRSYSYVIPRGDLCLDSMRVALGYLIGEHDFRNLCSFDLKNGVTNHRRHILSASVKIISNIDNASSEALKPGQYSFIEVVIIGQAFLYHQIRCIMTMLLLVGTRREQPELVRDLLDMSKCPARPNYNRASPLPLSLFNCKFSQEKLPLGWIYNHQALCNVYKHLKQLWCQYRTKSIMIERMLLTLEGQFKNEVSESTTSQPSEIASMSSSWSDFGLECDNMSSTKYIPVLKRPRDEPLEIKLKALEKKKKKRLDDET